MGNYVTRAKIYKRFPFMHKSEYMYDPPDVLGTPRSVHIQKCAVCSTRRSNVVIYKCGHICMCYICARSNHDNCYCCPQCSREITDFVALFYT